MSINRRDYLKKMALSAIALGASRLEVLGQRSGSKAKPAKQKAAPEAEVQVINPLAENFQTWPAGTRPASAPVKIYFTGLLDFYYNASGPETGTCGIGFVRGGGHHQPMIQIRENGQQWPDGEQIPNNSDVRVAIVNAAQQQQPTDVGFVKNGAADDFRWLTDMQAQSWYPGTQTRGNYGVKLFVRNGTFFTKDPTVYKLKQVAKIEQLGVPYLTIAALNKPAEVVGCEIALAQNQTVSLKVNGQERLRQDGTQYDVRFSNMCADMTPGGPCSFNWQHFQEGKRNDFHHHRDAVVLPGFATKLSVALAEVPTPARMRNMPKAKGDRHPFNTAEAPCMGAGYGGGPGPA
jgi:hypothetical protein